VGTDLEECPLVSVDVPVVVRALFEEDAHRPTTIGDRQLVQAERAFLIAGPYCGTCLRDN
jgi:hypothetical protein